MSKSNIKVKIEEKANIRSVVDIHSNIYSALNDHTRVELDVSDCVEVDLSMIQLVEAARIYARTTGKEFQLSAPVNANFATALDRAGFLENATDEDRRFWFNEGVE